MKNRSKILEGLLEYFQTMKPFNNVDDIPDIPILDKDEYENIIVKNLIRCGAIPKDKLQKDTTYIGACRNATKAKWNGKNFTYDRTKFGSTYEETINHFQDDDGYDVFVPIAVYEE